MMVVVVVVVVVVVMVVVVMVVVVVVVMVVVVVGFPCPFLKIEENCPNLAKKVLISEESALFVCIYGLIYYRKCNFKSILEKKHEHFSL